MTTIQPATAGSGGGAPPEEVAAVIAAAVAVARGLGWRAPVVTGVVAASPAGSPPWALAGRLDATAAGRLVQRRP